jgi:hypothetical protein
MEGFVGYVAPVALDRVRPPCGWREAANGATPVGHTCVYYANCTDARARCTGGPARRGSRMPIAAGTLVRFAARETHRPATRSGADHGALWITSRPCRWTM